MELIRVHHMEILFVGFSGGLWLLWDDSKVNVEIIGTHDQAISACVSWPGQSPWLFSAIYAKPCKSSLQYTPHLRPFWFEAMWLKHAEFSQFVSENWLGFSCSALDKSCAFVEPLKDDKGVWVEDAAGIKDLAVGFFSKLFAPVQAAITCVSIVRYQICINGELTNPFSPSSGIHQGDPLSPYLFVLCIKKLSHIIVDAVKRRLWKPIKTSRNSPSVSHLFFADDLVLFAEATPCQARVMKDCLDLFCSASGQTVNFAKSAIFCSPNTCKMVAKEIGAICGSPITEDLGKYLGFAVNLGKGCILDAEIWGLFFGLRLAVAKGFTKIIIEMDSKIAVNLFQQRDSLCFHPLAALLSNCGQMLRHFES
ncbi:hypothetical protein GBA52_026914 [Prunus armeniaca]|nr:hypothetical protein GBA52_026914 [Prunus armeniaca]